MQTVHAVALLLEPPSFAPALDDAAAVERFRRAVTAAGGECEVRRIEHHEELWQHLRPVLAARDRGPLVVLLCGHGGQAQPADREEPVNLLYVAKTSRDDKLRTSIDVDPNVAFGGVRPSEA